MSTDHQPQVKNESFCDINCQHQTDINCWNQIDIIDIKKINQNVFSRHFCSDKYGLFMYSLYENFTKLLVTLRFESNTMYIRM